MSDWITGLHPLVGIIGRTAIVYVCILLGIRIAGKREVGQMTPFDLTLILLLANAVQSAMVGSDTSLVGGLVAALVLFILNAALGKFVHRYRGFGRLVRGHAKLLVNRGIIVQSNLDQEGIELEDLMQALREHGVATLEDVRLAVLEIDGTISVLRYDDLSEESQRPHRRFRFLKQR